MNVKSVLKYLKVLKGFPISLFLQSAQEKKKQPGFNFKNEQKTDL